MFTRYFCNFCNFLIVKAQRYYETKSVFDLDSNTFGLHLLYRFYIVYILHTIISKLSS